MQINTNFKKNLTAPNSQEAVVLLNRLLKRVQ